MTRRRSATLPRREPNGRHDRALDRLVDARSPTEIRRLRDAALSGLRAPEWGSELGRLLLQSKLTPTQYEAGRRFALLRQAYLAALGAPDFPKRSLPDQNASSGHTEAPRDADRHQEAVRHYDEAIAPLGGSGGHLIVTLLLVCMHDASVSTADSLDKLRTALDALATHWHIPP